MTTTVPHLPTNKNYMRSFLAHTPDEWAQIIRDKITDPHIQGWAASVVSWDYDAAIEMKSLSDLMLKYDVDKHRNYSTTDILGALKEIGYEHAEVRVTLRDTRDDAHCGTIRSAYHRSHLS